MRPGVQIDVLAPAWSGPLLARMPEVRRAIALPAGHGEVALGRRWRVARELRAGRYDQAILLPNSLKSALVPFFAGIPRRTGWRGEMRYGLLNDLRLLDEAALPSMAERFAALALAPGAPLPEQLPAPRLAVAPAAARRSAERFGIDPRRPLLALCPGAEFGAAKRWPPQYYAELAREFLGRGWQVALYGSANDRGVCAQVRRCAGDARHCLDLAGRTSLAEVVDLLSLSAAAVSNDSGLMHVAAALRVPLLALYGATSPAFTPPLSPLSDTLVSDIGCAPCFARECPLGHHRCMGEMLPRQVVGALDALLARRGRG
jgi:heptosyltransferase-2